MEGFKTRLWVFSTINDQPNHWQNGRMETNISRTCHNNFSRWNLISIEDNCYLYHAVTFLGVLKTSLYKKKALKPHLQQEISLDTPLYFCQKSHTSKMTKSKMAVLFTSSYPANWVRYRHENFRKCSFWPQLAAEKIWSRSEDQNDEKSLFSDGRKSGRKWAYGKICSGRCL